MTMPPSPETNKGGRFIFPPFRGKVSRDHPEGFVCQGWGEQSCCSTRFAIARCGHNRQAVFVEADGHSR
jgi:hypothetical protein